MIKTHIIKYLKNLKKKLKSSIIFRSKIKKSDITITAIPGIAGLEPTIKLVEKAKDINCKKSQLFVVGI